ncbi:MAG: GTPase HflX [Calditrichaeota bacterium]|nr:GTPase HflX [Calditrichota bacterium]
MKKQLEIHKTEAEAEKAILVGVKLPSIYRWQAEEYLQELAMLADTAGVSVCDRFIQERDQIESKTYIGKGKVEEIRKAVNHYKADLVIFDDDLTPGQLRNLENLFEKRIIDRSTLILDIFAKHAQSREAKTQVELAQLQYTLPRLTRMWTHLSRQAGGGVGLRGPGETQLETDKRLIQTRIAHLNKELEKIERQRQTRKKGRNSMFRAALIGYTNVGKSSLMNRLSHSDVLVENKLFATLDSTVRQVFLNKDHQILLSDTVGFIRKLPHHLVASFKSTLDESIDADLLLHVVDLSHPNYQEHIETVNSVLKDLAIDHKPVCIIFNKVDLIESNQVLREAKEKYPNALFVSALRKLKIDQIKNEILNFIEAMYTEHTFELKLSEGTVLNSLYRLANVTHEEYEDNLIRVNCRISNDNYQKILKIREQIAYQV